LLGDDPIAVYRKLGAGKVIAISTSYLWTNAAIGRSDAALPLVALLDWASDGGARTILFDEYAHGLGIRRGAFRWIWETDLFYVIATAMLAVGIAAWRGLVRRGPPLEPRVIPRRAKEEFVVSMADIYARARRPRLAAGQLLRGYEDELTAVLGSDPEGRLQDPEFASLRTRLSAGGPADGSGLLRFARDAAEAYRKVLGRVQGSSRKRA
ncbi:MAG: hypothetical protein O6952_08685, partial [Planctomycetota bacterium]|nr:hypothetical protein [Planctomycetota bacterium]